MDLTKLTPEQIMILREMCATFNYQLTENMRSIKAKNPEMVQLYDFFERKLKTSQEISFMAYGVSI